MAGAIDWDVVRSVEPQLAGRAENEARLLELSEASAGTVRNLIDESIGASDRWVLVGGPPCQAYSLVGRARNSGKKGYRPEKDKRQTLYVEYLQILADHAPPVFIMENVKGLLSAKLFSERLFDRIREDLSSPVMALQREGRAVRKLRPRYQIHALASQPGLFHDVATDYVIRCEDYGIPQKRHRVILLGIRTDVVPLRIPALRPSSERVTVGDAIRDLPRVRSGLSKRSDSAQEWLSVVKGFAKASWLAETDNDVRARLRHELGLLNAPRADRGAEILGKGDTRPVLNHSTRSHIVEDLERYLFASVYAKTHKKAPVLSEFPKSLLPGHANVDKATGDAVFADRFRVQVATQPATTVTSHISKDGHYYIHPDPRQCRSLTVREAARLQTFPDDYFFCGPRTSQYQQVGNAVPPELARQIAAVVAGVLGE